MERMCPRIMRTPFDDAVFSGFAAMHGLQPDAMPEDAAGKGWNGAEGGPRTGLPESFPFFVFHGSSGGYGAVLGIYLHHINGESMVRYGRSSDGAWVHVEKRMLPDTVVATLVDRRVGEVLDLPGAAHRRIAMVEVDNGTVTMTLEKEDRV